MDWQLLSHDAARSAAKRLAPIIYQIVESPKDLLAAIALGEYEPRGWYEIYYRAHSWNGWLLVSYHFYHAEDWSRAAGGIIRDKLDSHHHDFEWVSIVEHTERTDGISWKYLACRNHEGFKTHKLAHWQRAQVEVEAQGHGIKPAPIIPGVELRTSTMVYHPSEYLEPRGSGRKRSRLVWLDEPKFVETAERDIWPEFERCGVTRPWTPARILAEAGISLSV